MAAPTNSIAASYLSALFEKLPCQLIKINFDLDGSFPVHQPDPLQFETLADLQKKVKEEGADLGIAPDGDGDRIFLSMKNQKLFLLLTLRPYSPGNY